MSKNYRVVFECYDSESNKNLSKTIIANGSINLPTDIFSFGFSHEEQIQLVQSGQDELLKEQSLLIADESEYCPHCPDNKLTKQGKRHSLYHDVFTDHKITIGRKRCKQCKYEPRSTVSALAGDCMSADFKRIQSELGASHTYRESERLFSKFSCKSRPINNHDRIKNVTEKVGSILNELHSDECEIATIKPAEELIVHVDGGHINTTEQGKRSFEAMASVIYKPESLVLDGKRNRLTSKHCAASSKSDNQQQMINNTIVAALKQGLSPQTKITALCDGANNCWQIIDALAPISGSILSILDWFHLSMKIQNISLPESIKPKLIRIKWHLWRGNCERAIKRITELEALCSEKSLAKLKKLKNYIINNRSKIVDYRKRKKDGLVFTSNLAESTVESLINQRCKGQQHMRWSREGLDPVLQLRASISSEDWDKQWKTAIKNSILIQ